MRWFCIFLLFISCQYQKADLPSPKETSSRSYRSLAKIQDFTQQIRAEFPEVSQLSVDDFVQLSPSDGQVFLVDIRPYQERKISTLPGAIDYDTFLGLEEGLSSNDRVVFYCTIGYRSSELAVSHLDLDYNVFNLEGGLLLWAHAGLKFLTPEGEETKTAHVYGPDWNWLPEGYTGTY